MIPLVINEPEDSGEFFSDSQLDKKIAARYAEITKEAKEVTDILPKHDNRMFKYNPFDDIAPSERNHLERTLIHALERLGRTAHQNRSVRVVDRDHRPNFVFDRYGVIRIKPLNSVKYRLIAKSRYSLLLAVVAKITKLVQDARDYMSSRELYYLTITVNRNNPKLLSAVLNDLCCMLGCSKVHLRILSQPKGIVYGNLTFKLKNNDEFNCMSSEGVTIPTPQNPIVEIISGAKMIIIVEKDSVLQKIINQNHETEFVERYKAILFTARGYPDINSRAFLKKVWSKLRIPIFILTDANPHGAEIACCYKFGSYATASEGAPLAIPQIRWLGLLPNDIGGGKVPNTSLVDLSDNDRKKLKSLYKRLADRNLKDWMTEIKSMQMSGKKAELESLDTHKDYLTRTFLPNKLRFASWV